MQPKPYILNTVPLLGLGKGKKNQQIKQFTFISKN